MIVKECPCGQKIKVKPSLQKRKKYCSKVCFYRFRKRSSNLKYEIKVKNKGWFKKGFIPWNTGMEESKQPSWKGDEVGYDALHGWVEKHLGKPRLCSNCGTTKGRIFQWSNKSGKYLRKLYDWQRLCVKCHHRYDYKKFNKRKKFYEKNTCNGM